MASSVLLTDDSLVGTRVIDIIITRGHGVLQTVNNGRQLHLAVVVGNLVLVAHLLLHHLLGLGLLVSLTTHLHALLLLSHLHFVNGDLHILLLLHVQLLHLLLVRNGRTCNLLVDVIIVASFLREHSCALVVLLEVTVVTAF